mgnify:FL=1|nr:MAG TPA: minor tail protein [Caudoviricetes sp.]
MLEDVYEQATNNYQGSAQNELNTYLDSIEAKTTKIKESWSQLWQSEGTTNTFKDLLTAGNGVLGLVNKIGFGPTAGMIGMNLFNKALDLGGTNYQLVL